MAGDWESRKPETEHPSPFKRHGGTLDGTRRDGSGIAYTEEVTGSSPVPPTTRLHASLRDMMVTG
jgi:hypothetical protein